MSVNKKIIFEELGVMDYAKAYDYQLKLFNETIKAKTEQRETLNRVLFVEHPHVYTLGKNGDKSNLIISEDFLKRIDATYYQTDRGGDITYHGYGQIVIYPIFDLNNYNILVRKYIHSIEEVIIRTLKDYEIEAYRVDKASGVWLLEDEEHKILRKMCALGVRVSRGVTMHGLAFNINTNLDYFGYINPCGFTDRGVTSLKAELKREVSVEEVKEKLKKYFIEIFENA